MCLILQMGWVKRKEGLIFCEALLTYDFFKFQSDILLKKHFANKISPVIGVVNVQDEHFCTWEEVIKV